MISASGALHDETVFGVIAVIALLMCVFRVDELLFRKKKEPREPLMRPAHRYEYIIEEKNDDNGQDEGWR